MRFKQTNNSSGRSGAHGRNCLVSGLGTRIWDSRKPRNLDDVSNIDFERYPESALDEMPEKIHRPEQGQIALSFKVPLSDLDLKGHVNNTKYFRWILNAFSQQDWKSNWRQIEANYLGEALPAEEIELIRSATPTGSIIKAHSKARNKTPFRARILFKDWEDSSVFGERVVILFASSYPKHI